MSAFYATYDIDKQSEIHYFLESEITIALQNPCTIEHQYIGSGVQNSVENKALPSASVNSSPAKQDVCVGRAVRGDVVPPFCGQSRAAPTSWRTEPRGTHWPEDRAARHPLAGGQIRAAPTGWRTEPRGTH